MCTTTTEAYCMKYETDFVGGFNISTSSDSGSDSGSVSGSSSGDDGGSEGSGGGSDGGGGGRPVLWATLVMVATVVVV